MAATYFQTLITSASKLNADLLDTTTATNKTVTDVEKSTWNDKLNGLNLSIVNGLICITYETT